MILKILTRENASSFALITTTILYERWTTATFGQVCWCLRLVLYKIDIAYNFRSLQSAFAGAKILDYYKSVITGSGRGKAFVISRPHRLYDRQWTTLTFVFRIALFNCAHGKNHRSEVGYGNEPRISAPGASIIADLATPLICSLHVSVPFVEFSW